VYFNRRLYLKSCIDALVVLINQSPQLHGVILVCVEPRCHNDEVEALGTEAPRHLWECKVQHGLRGDPGPDGFGAHPRIFEVRLLGHSHCPALWDPAGLALQLLDVMARVDEAQQLLAR